MDSFFSKSVDQRGGNFLGTAGFGHHFAQHGAKPDDDRNRAQRTPETAGDGTDHVQRLHAGQKTKQQR
ncbi:hypothetical protein D3C76_1764420 [compost metagenome]